MAHAFQPRSPVQRRPSSWPRRHRRRWLRANDQSAVGMLMSAIPSLPRAVLARLAEQMINRMDELDGDLDVELNGDELDATGSHEEDTPYYGFGPGDGYPGDPNDAEPEEDVDAAHDDGCGPVHLHGRRCWGSEHDEAGSLRPIFGVGQTRDPVGQEPVASSFRHVRKRQEQAYE